MWRGFHKPVKSLTITGLDTEKGSVWWLCDNQQRCLAFVCVESLQLAAGFNPCLERVAVTYQMRDLGRLRDLGGVLLPSRCLSLLACTPGSLAQPPGKKAKARTERAASEPSPCAIFVTAAQASSSRCCPADRSARRPPVEPAGGSRCQAAVSEGALGSDRLGRRLPEFKENELAALPDLDSRPPGRLAERVEPASCSWQGHAVCPAVAGECPWATMLPPWGQGTPSSPFPAT